MRTIAIANSLLLCQLINAENCLWAELHGLKIRHCGWDNTTIPIRNGLEVANINGVYNFTSKLHLVVGKNDIKYIARKDDAYVGPILQEFGAWEDTFQNAIYDIMSRKQQTLNSLYIDMGSNIGAWSLFMAKVVGNQGTVLSFEPQIDLSYLHSTSLLLNEFTNTQIINAFITNQSGYSPLLRMFNDDVYGTKTVNYGCMRMEELIELGKQSQESHMVYNIPNLRLDDLFYRDHVISKCPSFMKLDVEGHEIYALLGGENMLKECKPVLFVEAECRYLLRTLFYLLDSVGYTMAWVVMPSIDHLKPFHGRQLILNPPGSTPQERMSYLSNIMYSRNIIAVPKDDIDLLRNQPHFALIDIRNEREKDPNTWHTLDLHNKFICYDDSCVKWLHEPITTLMNNSDKVEYSCGGVVINEELVNMYKKYQID